MAYVPSKAQAQTPLKVAKMRKLISESSKMLAPDPSNPISWVVLIFGKPKFALLSYNIKYLDSYVKYELILTCIIHSPHQLHMLSTDILLLIS